MMRKNGKIVQLNFGQGTAGSLILPSEKHITHTSHVSHYYYPITMNNTTTDYQNVLQSAYQAWMAAGTIRRSRLRNKRFAYGDQWGDLTQNALGEVMTEGELNRRNGRQNITNNLLRQLIKTVVGRFRHECIDQAEAPADAALGRIAADNELDELDSRALEEFLISGCCVQRVDTDLTPQGNRVTVDNVNFNRFLMNAITDPRGRDCRLVGQLHDMRLPLLLRKLAGGSRSKATWIRHCYTQHPDERTAACVQALGADSQRGTDFWRSADPALCRAIEVWTLSCREVLLCHDTRRATLEVLPVSAERRLRGKPGVRTRWDVTTTWHCHWFSPMGDLLTHYDSPWPHGSHPFAMKFYPLTDGEVHAMIEDTIDQQKFINSMVSLVQHIMASSAKGVLLYPTEALPPDFTSWEEVRRIWASPNGLLPYDSRITGAKPEQAAARPVDVGAYEMIKLQMKLLEDISGVSGTLRGQGGDQTGAQLYRLQSEQAAIALADVYDTFNAFRRQRDRLVLAAAAIRRAALDDGAVHLVHQIANQRRLQVVVAAALARTDFHAYTSVLLHTQCLINLHQRLGRDVLRKVHLCLLCLSGNEGKT